MNLNENIAAIVAQTKFESNQLYCISFAFAWSKVEHLVVSKVNLGVGCWHRITKTEGKYLNHNEPLGLGKIHLNSASIGCEGYEAFIVADNITSFTSQIKNVVELMLQRYILQARKDAERLYESVAAANKHLE